MKKNNLFILIASFFIFFLSACDREIEPLEIIKFEEKSEEYYRQLREYKSSDHEVFFGWFGHWTAHGPSMGNYLKSVPDSVDIISIWGDWSNLSKEQIEDMRYVQKKKGTKVLFTIFAHGIPEPYDATKKGIENYASDLCDSVYKYDYDGLDLDYEPGYGGWGPLVSGVGHMENMEIFVNKLSERLGPASKSGKLLVIDGVPYHIKTELAKLFDYGIVQSYRSSGYRDLQDRFNNAVQKGWKPEQYIFTETFEEGYHATGGRIHELREGGTCRSLEGMARFKPYYNGDIVKRKGGCGTYHMEYDYRNPEPYKYTINAIRAMNETKKEN